MLTILGPAKTIDTSPHGITESFSFPGYRDHSAVLVEQLKQYSLPQLKKLMSVSDKLAASVVEMYASWKKDYDEQTGIHAITAFSGEVFNGLSARTLNEEELVFAQEHVRILSGLYGVLKPLDLMLPYRLEMGTRMKVGNKKNLYEYWKGIIPGRIVSDTAAQESEVLINLASNEYFKSINPGSFPHRIITPVFKESDGDGFRNVTIYAKKARGMMLRFIIQNEINDPEHLKAYDKEGYYYNTELSDKINWVFCR